MPKLPMKNDRLSESSRFGSMLLTAICSGLIREPSLCSFSAFAPSSRRFATKSVTCSTPSCSTTYF